MSWFDSIKTAISVPAALWHVIEIKKQISKNSEVVAQIRRLGPKEPLRSGRPPKYLVKSYFWAVRMLMNTSCLPRSLAIYKKLIEKGYKVEHKIGGNHVNQEFHAHAWVEFEGMPLNEAQDINQKFKEFVNHEDQSYYQ